VNGGPANINCEQEQGFPNPANPLQIYPVGENHQNFNEFLPTAGLQYHIDPDLMAYFSYAKGFKTGGWTTRLTSPLPYGSPAQSFGPETDNTYEVGLKSEWLDHRLLANLAAFYSQYNGIQLTYQISTSPVTQNAGNAVIKGFELQTQAVANRYLALVTNVGYMDAGYTYINPAAAATTGPVLPKTPRWKVGVGPEFHSGLSNGATVRVGANYTYTTEIYNDVQNTPLLRRPSEGMLDASGGLTSPGGKYTLQVGGTNVTNRRYVTTGQPQIAGGVVYGTYNAPSEWYATLSAKF
jgi:iron complex outermembrane receptor protein